MRRYKVKFTLKGETKYGIVDEYSDEAKKAAKEGCLIIEDATLPTRYKVKDDANVIDLPFSFGAACEYDQFVQAEYEKAEAKSQAAGKGVKVGKLLATGVGDGSAFYVITKVNKTTVKIEWRSFQGDRYVDMHFGYGGNYPLSQIKRFVQEMDGEELGNLNLNILRRTQSTP